MKPHEQKKKNQKVLVIFSPYWQDQQPTDTVPKVPTAMESDNSKPTEVEKQYNTRSKSQTTDKDVRQFLCSNF